MMNKTAKNFWISSIGGSLFASIVIGYAIKEPFTLNIWIIAIAGAVGGGIIERKLMHKMNGKK